MAKMKERVAYLHGLTKGLNVSERTPEGKAIMHIIDVLEDIADDVDDMYLQQQDLETYVETLDEDLNDLEEDFYEDIADYEDQEDFVETRCPVCHEDVSFDSDLLYEKDNVEVSCPNCGSVVYDNLVDGGSYDHHNASCACDHDHGYDHDQRHYTEYR